MQKLLEMLEDDDDVQNVSTTTGITRNKIEKLRLMLLNSTPFVRQYGILLTNGVLLYAKREAKQEIHRGV
jgi:hypothetical protein